MVDGLPAPLSWINATEIEFRGRRLTYFGGCDYFRLSWRPAVRRAAARALAAGPVNSAASRRTTGNFPEHVALEAALSRYLGGAATVLTPNGTLPGLHLAEALAGRVTHVLVDAGSHTCLAQAASLTGARVQPFDSGNPEAAARLARRAGPRARLAVFTDGLFALQGREAPLEALQAALPAGTWLVVDDAHGFGVLGSRGRGVLDDLQLDRAHVVQLGTLSKAAGVYGGFVAGPADLIGRIRAEGRLFAGSTPLPPPLAAAACVAVAWLGTPEAGRQRRRLLERSATLQSGLAALGRLPRAGSGAAFALVPRDETDQARLRRRLLARDIHPPFIRYPGGPEAGCFRFALSSAHSSEQCRRLADALSD